MRSLRERFAVQARRVSRLTLATLLGCSFGPAYALAVATPTPTPGVCASTYRDTVMSDSPTAYWRFGETTGTVAVDETDNYPGTYNNSPNTRRNSIQHGHRRQFFESDRLHERPELRGYSRRLICDRVLVSRQ